MLVMPSNNTGIVIGWLAGRFPGKIGHLYSPGGQRGPYPFIPYALDNGAFGARDKWTPDPWLKLLDWAKLSGIPPRWTLVPDVVGSREGTLSRWGEFSGIAKRYGWPLAFAVQDGMTPEDVPAEAEVIFVGGSTAWKWRTMGNWCSRFPRVHVGRVNTYRRLVQCEEAGAESCDGTGWTRGCQRQARGLVAYLAESSGLSRRHVQLNLCDGGRKGQLYEPAP